MINPLGIDTAGSSLIRNAKYQKVHVINEAAETQVISY